jgi:Na+-driven multidrug efflux pump
MASRGGWLVLLASWTTFSSSCCAAALRAPPLTALPRVHPRPARASPLLALSSAEPSFDKPKLDREFITIAAPAFIQFAAEPLARLVDAYYMGRLGAVALGGAGAAIAAQYAVAKLCNDPLLRSTISLVAAGDGAQAGDGSAEPTVRAEPVATALLLALFVGLVQVQSMQTWP